MKKMTIFLVAQLPFWAVLIGLQAVSTDASAQAAPKPTKAVVKSGKVSNATKAAVQGETVKAADGETGVKETTTSAQVQAAPKPTKAVVKPGKVSNATKTAVKGETTKAAGSETGVKETSPTPVKTGVAPKGAKEALKGGY